jgi:hypothetical protein
VQTTAEGSQGTSYPMVENSTTMASDGDLYSDRTVTSSVQGYPAASRPIGQPLESTSFRHSWTLVDGAGTPSNVPLIRRSWVRIPGSGTLRVPPSSDRLRATVTAI